MGKPSTTYWCENGHLLEDNPHHAFGAYDNLEDGEYPECPVCKSIKVYMECEWGDPDYSPHDVPSRPIRQEEMLNVDHNGNKYFTLVNVWDISKLKDHKQS